MMAKNIILSTGRTKEKWRDVSVVRLVGLKRDIGFMLFGRMLVK